jgi:hypothetical protein
MPDGEDGVSYEPFVVKSGVSMAANLREAFKTSPLLLSGMPRARVLIDSPVLMMPVELFDESTMELAYRHAYPDSGQDIVSFSVLPDLKAVAVFSVNRDLRLVVDDHFQHVRLIPAISPVWSYLHQRSYTGPRQKLYGYFHEKRLEVLCFQQNRFKFCNTFEARYPRDVLYYLLHVWTQLQLQADADELHLVGDLPEQQEQFVGTLRRYLKKVYIINPSADFGHAPVTGVKGMPFDLQTLFVKGR